MSRPIGFCKWILLLTISTGPLLEAQISTFPYFESFEAISVPSLPQGWSSSQRVAGTNDFTTLTGTAGSTTRSGTQAVGTTNSRENKFLVSPPFDFSNKLAGQLQFWDRRSSSSFDADVVVEASTDSLSFDKVGGPFNWPGNANFTQHVISLPDSLSNKSRVWIRWRIIATAAGGTTSTYRIDDVSVTVLSAFDLALTSLKSLPAQPGENDPITLQATVKNLAAQQASGYFVRFFRDVNNNLIADAAEEFASSSGPSLLAGDSGVVTATHPPLFGGDHRFIAVASLPADENRANDTASTLVSVPAPRRSLIINEIMYEPLQGQNEWIELLNRSSLPVDLARWRFSDRPTATGSTNTFTITTQSRVVQPGEFVVVAAESTILSLFPHLRLPADPAVHLLILNRSSGFSFNNDGDDVVLADRTGSVIDSVSYSPKWHHPDVTDTRGRSLERINPNLDSNDPRNWSTSALAAGGSPGRPNSVFTSSLPSAAALSFSPNPFSPDGDGFEDFCIIRYNLPLSTSLIRITVFDVRGRTIRTLANSELSGSSGEIIWDGLDDEKRRVRVGPYVVLIEAIDGQGGTVATAKGVVVVATKL